MSAWSRCPLCGLTADVHTDEACDAKMSAWRPSGILNAVAGRPISEQRHRARLAALDVAQSLTGFSVTAAEVDDVLPLAEKLEAWLMRPEPIDVTGPN